MEMNNIIVDPTYKQWGVDIERRFRQQQIKAVVQVNSCKIEFYWSLGRDICEEAQWFPLTALPSLAFDHEDIIRDAIKRFEEVVK